MFKHQIRIAYRDVTVGNHVYYARYLDLLEVIRNEVFRDIDFDMIKLQQAGVIFPVVECHLQYHAAARYDDLLTIESRFSDVGRVQWTLNHRILRDTTLLVTARTRHAVTSQEEKPIRMPKELLLKLQSLSPTTSPD